MLAWSKRIAWKMGLKLHKALLKSWIIAGARSWHSSTVVAPLAFWTCLIHPSASCTLDSWLTFCCRKSHPCFSGWSHQGTVDLYLRTASVFIKNIRCTCVDFLQDANGEHPNPSHTKYSSTTGAVFYKWFILALSDVIQMGSLVLPPSDGEGSDN